MKSPKLLPWIAHKNGIGEQLALNLWRRAASEAERTSGCSNRSDYYGLAVSRFIELAEHEGEICVQREPFDFMAVPDVNGLLREQNRYWQANLLATQQGCAFWLSNLKYLFSGQKLVF